MCAPLPGSVMGFNDTILGGGAPFLAHNWAGEVGAEMSLCWVQCVFGTHVSVVARA